MSRRFPAALLGFVGVLLGLGLIVSPATRVSAPSPTGVTTVASVASSASAGSSHQGIVDRQAERLLAPARKVSKTGPLTVTPATPILTAPYGVRVARAPPTHTSPRLSTVQRPTGRSPPAPAGT